jgi:hypothetical protein
MNAAKAFRATRAFRALRAFRTLCLAAIAATAAAGAHAQYNDALMSQQIAAMNAAMTANLARGQQQVNQVVQQRMQDPAVQRAWQGYLQQTGGRPQMDYPSFTYWYIYSAGFSADGMRHVRNTEHGIQQREQASRAALRQAEWERGQAQAQQRQHYSERQQEAGRQLQGQSTYVAPNGQALVLPHTWQRGRDYVYGGYTYRVDRSGSYYALATDGSWVPLSARF